MAGLLFGVYAVTSYLIFFAAFLYAIAFVGDLPIAPKTIDSGRISPLVPTLVVNALLLGLFAIQHSVMARPAFKRWWTRLIPPPIERSTYVLFASLALVALYLFWRPLPQPIWTVTGPAAMAIVALFWIGEFRTPVFYRLVRHPLYAGFILAFWATPTMTLGHLVFAVGTLGYILIAIQLEERDLVATFGERYQAYRRQVGMLAPKVGGAKTTT
jgi:protein-S-isoprenylcysteine O-methyltransferase Ste14